MTNTVRQEIEAAQDDEFSGLVPSPEYFNLLCRALDHIRKTAAKSRTSTRRLRWIELRAADALAGRPYTQVDLPKDGGPATAAKLQLKLSAHDAEMEAVLKDRVVLAAALEAEREKLRAIVQWLEVNQPDVFKRGLWDAINKGV